MKLAAVFGALLLACYCADAAPPGGFSDPLDNPEQYVGHALRALRMTNRFLRQVEVLEARTKVVQGVMIYMEIQGSNGSGARMVCDMTVWERPWLSEGENFIVEESTC